MLQILFIWSPLPVFVYSPMSAPLPSLSQALHFQSAVLFSDDLSELVVSVILEILEKN